MHLIVFDLLHMVRYTADFCFTGQFPGAEGLVASGMSAQFKVRFMPDSLGEYCDEITVQSQCAESLIVKVIAKRPPPVLTRKLHLSL